MGDPRGDRWRSEAERADNEARNEEAGALSAGRLGAPERARSGLPGCRILGLVAVVALAVATLTPAVERLAVGYAEPAGIEPAEAIVVLGGAFTPDGWLDAVSLHRLVEGMRLYRQGLAPLLVLSGSTPKVGPSEPEVRARLARDLGMPPAAILTVVGANTTYEESVLVAAALRPRGLRSILLVTGPLHLVRARAVFERAGFTVHPAPAIEIPLDAKNPPGRIGVARMLVQEIVGRAYYRLRGYL
jgi:uncharacterized SAM-binding protein YcdF (DUF218 family)